MLSVSLPVTSHADEEARAMKDVAAATLFLLENGSVNGVNLNVDNGFLLT